jgi:cobalt-zinc-cadmium resistance protein CzcA
MPKRGMLVSDSLALIVLFLRLAPWWSRRNSKSASPAALGLLPVALATGVGTDTQRPFALVIVSGLFTRLLISIFLMPVLYALVARPADRLEV